MLSEAIDTVAAVLKAIFLAVVWNIVLFNLGRCALLLLTAGSYPRGRALEAHVNRISAAGVAVLVAAWSALALYNNLHTGNV